MAKIITRGGINDLGPITTFTSNLDKCATFNDLMSLNQVTNVVIPGNVYATAVSEIGEFDIETLSVEERSNNYSLKCIETTDLENLWTYKTTGPKITLKLVNDTSSTINFANTGGTASFEFLSGSAIKGNFKPYDPKGSTVLTSTTFPSKATVSHRDAVGTSLGSFSVGLTLSYPISIPGWWLTHSSLTIFGGRIRITLTDIYYDSKSGTSRKPYVIYCRNTKLTSSTSNSGQTYTYTYTLTTSSLGVYTGLRNGTYSLTFSIRNYNS